MGTLLSTMIEQWPGSSNTFLKGLNMDRSTFYKVKNGKRKPTKEQFCKIVRQLNPEETIRRQLIEEFEMERIWRPEQEHLLLIVREFLQYLNFREETGSGLSETASGNFDKKPVPQNILNAFAEEMSQDHQGKIQMRIPPSILDKYDWSPLLSVLDKGDSAVEVKFLLNNTVEENYDVLRKLRHMEQYFSFVKKENLHLSVFRENFFSEDDFGIQDPYPYYLITDRQIILIRKDLEEDLVIRRESVIRNYSAAFEYRYSQSYTVMKAYDDPEIIEGILRRCFRKETGHDPDRNKGISPLIENCIDFGQMTLYLCHRKELFLHVTECTNVLVRIRERALVDGMYHWFQTRGLLRELEEQIGLTAQGEM